jgi:two-component system, cell cycle response regulator
MLESGLIDYADRANRGLIKKRLQSLGLEDQDQLLAQRLHAEVIDPHIEQIVDDFYTCLAKDSEFAEFMDNSGGLARLRDLERVSLSRLGLSFHQPTYFMDRQELGSFYAQLGLPLNLFIIAYCQLQQILIGYVPKKMQRPADDYQALFKFILKIMALDLSLAVQAYHLEKVEELESSVESLKTATAKLQKRASRQVEKLQESVEELKVEVSTDDLTGVATRSSLLESLQQAIAAAREENTSLCLIMADIDFFKKVNDTHGHLAGDEVLRVVTDRIQSSLREFDLVGRYGGEEFLVILPQTGLETARAVAERVRARVAAQPVQVPGERINTTISLGIACWQRDWDATQLIEQADAAMYAAKQAGRNRVVVAGD